MTHMSNGSEWSGINQYQSLNKSEPASPNPIPRGALATPPSSGGPPFSPLDPNAPDSNGLSPHGHAQSPSQNPSPPSSLKSKSRTSDGTLADKNSKRHRRMEEVLSQHYAVLRRFLHGAQRDEAGNIKSNKARDKLLRLSAVQFVELSTDVYDELLRRQAASAAARPGPPRPEVPPHLMPRSEFHEKRNHARQKLSSLQHQRFKDLATDVFCELERRFPQFVSPADRRGSETPSARGRYPSGPNGYGPRPDSNGQYGYPPPRSQSRGPPSAGGRGYPPSGPPGGRFPPRQGSLGAMSGSGPPSGLGINGETIPENAPYQKSFQSNTIVPNKSTMVEDDDDNGEFDDDDDRRSDAFALDRVLQSRRETTTTLGGSDKEKKLVETQSQVSTLEERVEELELSLKKKDDEIESMRGDEKSRSDTEKHEWEETRTDLTKKLTDAQELNTSLENELSNVRRQQETMELEMQQHLEQTSGEGSGGGEWKSRYDDLDRKHNALKSDLQSQQQVTEQVRQEASNFLKEMKELSAQTGSSWEREEGLVREVQRLEEEVKLWKGRYERSKTQLRHLRSSSSGLPGHTPDPTTLLKQSDLTRPDGLVKDIHVTKFQTSIDELLRTARSSEPSGVLEQMKGVVLAVRHIMHGVDASNDSSLQLPPRVKARVSSTANNVITASKNFANSNGLSPVSLLDAAASHLSAAVVDFVRHVKIRPTPEDELAEANEDDNVAAMKSPGYFSVAPSQSRVSANESIYSAISSPSMKSMAQTNPRLAAARSTLQNDQGYGAGMKQGDKALEELRLYLEEQTEGLVQSIQALVSSIRAENDLPQVRTHIDTIADVVGKVIASTDTAITQPDANPALRDRIGSVVQLLQNCRDNLVSTGTDGDNLTDPSEIRAITNKLPPIAFQIARETKELVQRVDQLENESRDEEDDDFR